MFQKPLGKNLLLPLILLTATFFASDVEKGSGSVAITTGPSTLGSSSVLAQPISQSVQDLAVNGDLVVMGFATFNGGTNISGGGTALGTCSPLLPSVTIDATNINIGQCSPAASETVNINALNSTTGPVNIGNTAGNNAITFHTGLNFFNINNTAGDTGHINIGTQGFSVNGAVNIGNNQATTGNDIFIDNGASTLYLGAVSSDTGIINIGTGGNGAPLNSIINIGKGNASAGHDVYIDSGASSLNLNTGAGDTGNVFIGHGTAGGSPASDVFIQTPGFPSSLIINASGVSTNQSGGFITLSANANGTGNGGPILLQSNNTATTTTPANATITLDVSSSTANQSGRVILNVGDNSGGISGGNLIFTGLQTTCLAGANCVPLNMVTTMVTVGGDTLNVGQVIAVGSSKRFKANIKPMSHEDSSQIYQLEPVEFHAKSNPEGAKTFGLIAEMLAEKGIFLNAIGHDQEGRINHIDYQQIFMAMLNEFIKHKADYDALKTNYSALKELVLALQNELAKQ